MSTRFVGTEVTLTRSSVVFEIVTRAGPRYLRVDRTPHLSSQRMVVVVDAKRFVRIWEHSVSHELAAAARQGHEFAEVDKDFAQSHLHPFPIPVAGALTRIKRGALTKLAAHLLPAFASKEPLRGYRIELLYGHQRVLWLLANGATSFPVECAKGDAETLHCLIGVHASVVASVDELTPSMAITDIHESRIRDCAS